MAPPLYSSEKVAAALVRLGCEPRPGKGSHRVYIRDDHGRTRIASVPMGRHEVARGTLRSILQLLNISEREFRKAVR